MRSMVEGATPALHGLTPRHSLPSAPRAPSPALRAVPLLRFAVALRGRNPRRRAGTAPPRTPPYWAAMPFIAALASLITLSRSSLV